MKKTLAKIAFLAIFSTGICSAQSPSAVEDFKPSTFNQPGQEYPQVNSQGYARFKIVAPAADSVRVSLGLGGKRWHKTPKSRRWNLDGYYRRPNGRRLSLL